MFDGFTFGDKATWDFDMHVERFPRQSAPARKMTTFSVPGRSGDLHAFEDAWENYTQSYEVYFHGNFPTPEQAHAVKAWLMGGSGYQILKDMYDPNYYRKAIFTGPMDIENILNKYGRCTINFNCAPQSYLVNGSSLIGFTAPGTLYNPTLFNAQPTITIYGTAAGTVSVGGVAVEIKSITDPIVLDCELMQAFSQPGEGAPVNQNSNIYVPEFPMLQPGANALAFTGGITKVEIIPRWWTL